MHSVQFGNFDRIEDHSLAYYAVVEPAKSLLTSVARYLFRNLSPCVQTLNAAIVVEANRQIDLSEHPFISGLLIGGGVLSIHVANTFVVKNPKWVWDAIGEDPQFSKACLERGADPNYSEGRDSLIVKACRVGDFESAKYLVDFGADLNRRYQNRIGTNSILNMLCQVREGWQELADLADYFIKAGAEITPMADETSPVLPVLENGNLPLAKVLLQAGVDPNPKTHSLETPFTLITNINTYLFQEAEKMVLHFKTNPDTAYSDNSISREIDISLFEEAVEMLLDFGANPNLANSQGVTPLYIASVLQSSKAVKMLRDAGADPFAQITAEGPVHKSTPMDIANPEIRVLFIPSYHQLMRREMTGHHFF